MRDLMRYTKEQARLLQRVFRHKLVHLATPMPSRRACQSANRMAGLAWADFVASPGLLGAYRLSGSRDTDVVSASEPSARRQHRDARGRHRHVHDCRAARISPASRTGVYAPGQLRARDRADARSEGIAQSSELAALAGELREMLPHEALEHDRQGARVEVDLRRQRRPDAPAAAERSRRRSSRSARWTRRSLRPGPKSPAGRLGCARSTRCWRTCGRSAGCWCSRSRSESMNSSPRWSCRCSTPSLRPLSARPGLSNA
jgi:hypothetical protein